MRVAIVTECFTPTWNGVTNSVVRVVDHLERTGHQALVIAPASGRTAAGRQEPPPWSGFRRCLARRVRPSGCAIVVRSDIPEV